MKKNCFNLWVVLLVGILRFMEEKRWNVILKTVHKDGNGATPRHWGTNATLGPSAVQFSSVQSLSRVWLFATPWTAALQASLSNSWTLPKPMSIVSVMPSNHLILCHSLLLLPSTFPGIRVFSNESALRIRWPKYCSFSFSISPSNEYSGLISFKIDWFDFLTVQRTLKNLFWYEYSYSCFLLVSICMEYLFPSLHFQSLCVPCFEVGLL